MAPPKQSAAAADNVDNIPASKRRMDSLSWLIQGDDVCGAVCFDGEQLLLATNNHLSSPLVNNVTSFLTDIAVITKEKRHHNNFKALIDAKYNAFLESAGNFNLMRNPTFHAAFQDSLDKVTNSLIASYLDPRGDKAFPDNVRDAIENSRYQFIPGIEREHAEMKLIGQLIEDNKLNSDSTYYLGISKRCCLNCEKVVEAVNVVFPTALEQNQSLEIREEGHNIAFPAAIPPFLVNPSILGEKQATLIQHFLQKRYPMHFDVQSDPALLQNAFRERPPHLLANAQLHRRSSSFADKFAAYNIWEAHNASQRASGIANTTLAGSTEGINPTHSFDAGIIQSSLEQPSEAAQGRGRGRGRGSTATNSSSIGPTAHVNPINSFNVELMQQSLENPTEVTLGRGRGRGRGSAILLPTQPQNTGIGQGRGRGGSGNSI